MTEPSFPREQLLAKYEFFGGSFQGKEHEAVPGEARVQVPEPPFHGPLEPKVKRPLWLRDS